MKILKDITTKELDNLQELVPVSFRADNKTFTLEPFLGEDILNPHLNANYVQMTIKGDDDMMSPRKYYLKELFKISLIY